MGAWRRHRGKIIALALSAASIPAAHAIVGLTTRIEPPRVTIATGAGAKSFVRTRAGVREVYLEGSPEAIGAAHARLMRDRMIADEELLWADFAKFVPLAPARALLLDVSRIRYRNLDHGVPDARRRELAAQATVFDPDPFADRMPTYQRMLFLHALYDIALGFEHSPVVGCTSFGLGPGATADGHAIVARAFDFEAAPMFDADKTVYFVHEDGLLPVASVAWPGFIGVVSGMNVEGVTVVVHGARAKEPVTDGLPVAFSLRDVLSRAHDTPEAIAILRAQPVMVSHIVFVGDSAGRFAVVERAPGEPAFVKDAWPDPDRAGVTNHLEGPLKNDSRNVTVERTTTTHARRDRLDELLAAVPPKSATVASALDMLRDHACAHGEACPLGDRRSIDALIATHGIVADATDRALWVSAGPHLSGKFVRFDLRAIFAGEREEDPPSILPEDPILNDARYEAGRARAGGPKLGGDAR